MNKTPLSLNILFTFALLGVILWGGFYIFTLYSFFDLRQQGIDTAVGAITVDRSLKKDASSGDVLKKYFVIAGQEASYISSIEDMCKGISVVCTIQSIDESDTLKGIPVKTLHLIVTSSGAFDNTMQLLRLFELSSYPLTLSNVTFSSGTPWKGSFDISLPVLIN